MGTGQAHLGQGYTLQALVVTRTNLRAEWTCRLFNHALSQHMAGVVRHADSLFFCMLVVCIVWLVHANYIFSSHWQAPYVVFCHDIFFPELGEFDAWRCRCSMEMQIAPWWHQCAWRCRCSSVNMRGQIAPSHLSRVLLHRVSKHSRG